MNNTRVLVVYGSEHNSTHEIAEFVAKRIQSQLSPSTEGKSVKVDCVSIDDKLDTQRLALYDWIILGSAVHFGTWLSKSYHFAETHTTLLKAKPISVFSVGMPDAIGDAAIAKETQNIKEIVEKFIGTSTVGSPILLSGKSDINNLNIIMRIYLRLFGGVSGDFRNWDLITKWTDEIVEGYKDRHIATDNL